MTVRFARRVKAARLASFALLYALAVAPAHSEETTPEVGAVDALQKAFGVHPGFRSNHAKGVVLSGSFVPSAEGAKLSKASLFAGPPVKATIRFSDPTGLPTIPDTSPGANPQGMAVKFTLADGGEMDMALISSKYFPVTTAAEFRDLILAVAATKPDSPKPSPIEQFLGAHPAALRYVQTMPGTPASFATQSYFGLNAFRLVAASGNVTNVRFRWQSLQGEQRLSTEEVKAKGDNFLGEDIRERVRRGPVKFALVVQIGAKGDPTDDATKDWPDDRPIVTLGELTITDVVADSAEAEKALVFMPSLVPDGIEPSDDPLISSRSGAYADSFGRRNQ